MHAVTKENNIIADVAERVEVIDMHNKILACKLKKLVTCLIKGLVGSEMCIRDRVSIDT